MQTRLPTANLGMSACAIGHVLPERVRMLGRSGAACNISKQIAVKKKEAWCDRSRNKTTG